jgi:hypothetical protein
MTDPALTSNRNHQGRPLVWPGAAAPRGARVGPNPASVGPAVYCRVLAGYVTHITCGNRIDHRSYLRHSDAPVPEAIRDRIRRSPIVGGSINE